MKFSLRSVSYCKECLWLLDVWLIHNAFLSAINRLWEFRHMHTHHSQTTGDMTLYVTHSKTHALSILIRDSWASPQSLLLWHFLSRTVKLGKAPGHTGGPGQQIQRDPKTTKLTVRHFLFDVHLWEKIHRLLPLQFFPPVIMCLNCYSMIPLFLNPSLF